MDIFTGPQPCISKLYNIAVYYSEAEANGCRYIEYNGNLYSYELIYFLSGEYVTSFNGKKIDDFENIVEYLPKGVADAKYTVDRKTHGHCIDIYFDSLDPLPRQALSFQTKDMKLRRLFEQSERLWTQKKDGYYTRCMSAVYEIISTIQDAARLEYATASQYTKIENSIAYMDENYCNRDFSYTTLAEASGLSYSYFKSLFIKKYGISPSKYITSSKITRAMELLITGRYTVTKIAEMTGFENVYYFSTVFKKETGVSPKDFVKNGR